GQRYLLEVGVYRRRRQQARGDLRQIGVGVFAQAQLIGFRSLGGAPHESSRIAEEFAVEAGAAFQEQVTIVDLAITILGLGDFIPGFAGLRVGLGAQFLFLLELLREHFIVVERTLETAIHLQR